MRLGVLFAILKGPVSSAQMHTRFMSWEVRSVCGNVRFQIAIDVRQVRIAVKTVQMGTPNINGTISAYPRLLPTAKSFLIFNFRNSFVSNAQQVSGPPSIGLNVWSTIKTAVQL